MKTYRRVLLNANHREVLFVYTIFGILPETPGNSQLTPQLIYRTEAIFPQHGYFISATQPTEKVTKKSLLITNPDFTCELQCAIWNLPSEWTANLQLIFQRLNSLAEFLTLVMECFKLWKKGHIQLAAINYDRPSNVHNCHINQHTITWCRL